MSFGGAIEDSLEIVTGYFYTKLEGRQMGGEGEENYGNRLEIV